MGFDAVFMARICLFEKFKRRREKSLEYVHFPSSDNLGK
jgi:hypothetical protein